MCRRFNIGGASPLSIMQKVRQSLKHVRETPYKICSAYLINRNTGEIIPFLSSRVPFNESFYSNYLLYFNKVISQTWNKSSYRIVFDIIDIEDSTEEIPLPF